jgi:hypothetical protein
MPKANGRSKPDMSIRNDGRQNLWAKAMADYEEDRGVVNRANGKLRKRQKFWEDEHNISAKEVRRRYKELDLSEPERLALYAAEQESRRALDLWSASSPEDFQTLMERAASTPPAAGDAADKLAGARAYNDGFNCGAHGKLGAIDNPHMAGSIEHVQWAHGMSDGIDYKETFGGGDVDPRQDPEPEPPPPLRKLTAKEKRAEAKRLADEVAANVAAELDEKPGLFSDDVPPGILH